MSFEEGDARKLTYPAESFDLVTCRLGMHHFESPEVQLREMIRVCRSEGHVAVIDVTTSEDGPVAALHNRLERLRDPSHTRALTSNGLRDLAKGCGLQVSRSTTLDADRSLDDWMDLTETSLEAREIITGEMEHELSGGPATGMHPFRQEGQLMFYHSWVMLVCQKGAQPA